MATEPSIGSVTVTATDDSIGAVAVTPTIYIILTRDVAGWKELSTVSARSAEAAIRTIGAAGVYVAVPARSFKPVTVSAVQTTVLKLEGAK